MDNCQKEGIAAGTLKEFGLTLDIARTLVVEAQGVGPQRTPSTAPQDAWMFQTLVHEGRKNVALRDQFAAMALQGWIIKNGFPTKAEILQNVTDSCYEAADAMLKSRDQK